MTGYLLDANIFIQAKNLHYGFDFCPAFWDWLVVQNEAGKVASIEKVGDELRAGNDVLGQVPHKQIDRRSALQCEARLLGNDRQRAHQKRGLAAKSLIHRHRGFPER